MKHIGFVFGLACAGLVSAQTQTAPAAKPVTPPAQPAKPATPAPEVLPTVPDFLRALKPRELGPTTMGGRVSDIAVYEKKPQIFYVAAAGGGLWRTSNGGLTTEDVFNYESSAALGVVSVNQNDPDDVWVGTGDQNNRNSTSWGDGVYRSKDGGKTWTHLGLEDSQHISRIVLDAKHPDTAYVACLGPLWNKGGLRGVMKTTDGGKTWKNVLPGNELTGIIDLAADPNNSDVLYAAKYERIRTPYSFSSGGPGSGLYKSTDGGASWTKLGNGFPGGNLGRIGIGVYRKNPNILVTCVEAEKGGGIYRSEDAGQSWIKTSSVDFRGFYFSQIRFNPQDDQEIWYGGTNLHHSYDGGKTFRTWNTSVHVDHHAVWVDPNDADHLMIGEDGGAAQSRDHGKSWQHINTMRIGQFYAVAFDFRKPYYVYGGLQDNGSWGGPTETDHGGPIYSDWYNVNGGDGFYVAVDPENWRYVYSESQGGAADRTNVQTGEDKFVRPSGKNGDRLRFNWDTPIEISPWNAATVYIGSNKLMKSVNRGDSWKAISPDLTTNNPFQEDPHGGVSPEDTGAERHCTIISISESPKAQDQIWCGTDDGLVQLTQDEGVHWEEVGHNIKGLPANTWCSRVEASHFSAGRAFATFDGHRTGDHHPYIFETDDYGKTWKPLAAGLKMGDCCYVVREGLLNPDLLFVGTEMGLYISIDRGKTWTKFNKDNGFPTVRVDDVREHPRDHDLIVGTHGRSLWQIPVYPLEQMGDRSFKSDVILFKTDDAYAIGRNGGFPGDGDGVWVASNSQPNVRVYFYLKTVTKDRVRVVIQDANGSDVGGGTVTPVAGLNEFTWSPGAMLGRRRRGAGAGGADYTVVLHVGDKEFKTAARVEDVSQMRSNESTADDGL